jgi:exopolyphosphatase/guanosine-5'-triphosphate,3'-diphosphate pyrophosphatase
VRMIAAVMDLGTNTFHLLIAEVADVNDLEDVGNVTNPTDHVDPVITTNQEPKILFKTNLPVKLGEGKINENLIIPEAFQRGIKAMQDFKKEIDKHDVHIVKAIATSALRSASNGGEFVMTVREQAGIDITIIDGDQEATYIYEGVKATGLVDSTSLIIDIGGGSTEFILCDPEGIIWKKSYNIGAARLQQAYFHSDPINMEDQNAIQTRLVSELEDLKAVCSQYKPKHLIGSAGAFESFSTLTSDEITTKPVTSSAINIDDFLKLSNQLISSTHHERSEIKGLIALRVDMIVIASLITNYVMKMIEPDRLSVSTYDLKMGVLTTLMR